MQFWVYILHCADGSFYTGHTDNLERRLGQHEHGICCDWTSRRRPVKLAWADTAPSRLEALEFERRVKNWSRAKKIALIESDWVAFNYHAKKPRERPSSFDSAQDRISLGTNGEVGTSQDVSIQSRDPFVPSVNEGRVPEPNTLTSTPTPFVPSEVEGRVPQTEPVTFIPTPFVPSANEARAPHR